MLLEKKNEVFYHAKDAIYLYGLAAGICLIWLFSRSRRAAIGYGIAR